MKLIIAVIAVVLVTSPFVQPVAAAWEIRHVPQTDLPPAGELAFYRCFIRVPDNMTSRAAVDLWADSAMLSFADFPGPFAIFLNGKKIAEDNALPREPRRRFKIPKGILQKKLFNVLALRLDGEAAKAGFRVVPVLHGYHDELVLEGGWEFSREVPTAADLGAVSEQPVRATFTEANFREASTLLAPNAELMRGDRLSPADALAGMRTPPDLAVDLILHEPVVTQPTHFSFDGHGRLWVAQYRQYPYPAGLKMVSRDKYYRSTFDHAPPAPPHHDRGRDIISVHEDSDGDGTLDRHREVLAGLNMANAVLHGRGGIWVMQTPYLLFYPDANGDDVPDGDPEVCLAGFGLEDTHSVANGLAWGPDGWIYGAQGSTTTSHVRRPVLDPAESPGVYHESCMVWRYHPATHVYEIFAEGGGNNFGLEFDSEGRLYSGHNGGETRGWHFVQSGVYLKQSKDPGKFGPPANPFAFGELPMMKTTTTIARFSHHFAIAEGSAVPPNYFGRLFSADPLHHNVVVSDRSSDGSTFATTDRGFALESADPAFRPVFVANAPDGSIYVADFCEQYIAHGQHYQGQIDPDSGRIYRLRGKAFPLIRDVDLARKSSGELLATLGNANRWHRQTAVRLLGERHDPNSKDALIQLLRESEMHPALEALWALHQAGWLNETIATMALEHRAASVRGWTIRLLGDRKQLPETFVEAVVHRILTETDPEVRCQMASTARRLPSGQAMKIVAALLHRDVDGDDPFIPLLCWWTIERGCDDERAAVLRLVGIETPVSRGNSAFAPQAAVLRSQMIREHILPRLMRRFASKGARGDLLVCAQLLRAALDDNDRKQLLRAFDQAFNGRALPSLPDELVAALAEAGQNSPLLQLRRGAAGALEETLAIIQNPKAKREDRLALLRAVSEVHPSGAIRALLAVAKSDADIDLRKAALNALAAYEETTIGEEIVAAYPALPPALQRASQGLLSIRAPWSMTLLKFIEGGGAKAADISAETVARFYQHSEKPVLEMTRKLFPRAAVSTRPDTRAAVERIVRALKSAAGNPYAGEGLFMERCGLCHQLFHKGGQIGPNLTAYQRDDLGTMLPSILDPSAEIREGYVNYFVETNDGRTLNGFLADQDVNVITLRGFDGQDVTVARADVREVRPAEISLMPAGLLDGLGDQQLRDLFAYLRIPQPISK